MDEDFALQYSFPIYPLQTPDIVYAVDGREAAILMYYTVTHVDIGGHKSKVLYHLMKTKTRLDILSGASWLIQYRATMNIE